MTNSLVQLLKFAWRTNRIGTFQFGNTEHPIQFYFVREDLVAFKFPIEISSGMFETLLYILRNEDLDHDKKRRAVLSIEHIENSFVVNKETFDTMLSVLNARYARGIGYITGPTLVTKTTNGEGTAIEFTFDKSVILPQSPDEFSIVINTESPINPVSVEILDPDTNKEFGLNLPEGVQIKSGDVVTVSYTWGTVFGTDGSVLASFSDVPVTDNVLIPEVTGIETNTDGDIIQISFTKAMGTPGANAEDDFSIVVEGKPAFTPISVTNHATDTKIIELTLDVGNVIVATDVITLSYDGDSIRSTDGGVLQPFYGKIVENNVTAE